MGTDRAHAPGPATLENADAPSEYVVDPAPSTANLSLSVSAMRRLSSSVAALALALLLAVVLTSAECPNGCSGNGACLRKDMCDCYKNYQGNDCADRTCQFGYAHVDTPKGDINMNQFSNDAGWILAESQQDPEGTYEYFSPAAKTNEAHFYMECSNKGLCDRATGLCTCFDGFEGSACQRTTCPSKCSGHGTCESLRELGAKAGGTLAGIEYPGGAVEYDLWDANSTYGCRCDPWYRGPDCNKRTCKVGVDPLFLAIGTARYETFVIVAGTGAAAYPAAVPWIRLRVFDYYGESYITSKIPILDRTDATDAADNKVKNAAAVQKALKEIPNLTFRDIKCESIGVGPDMGDFTITAPAAAAKGMLVICQYIDNPGRHRIPEVVSYFFDVATADTKKAMVVTTGVQGEDDEWFTMQSTMTATLASATTITVGGGGTFVSNGLVDPTVAAPLLMKIGDDVVLATGFTAPTITLGFSLAKTLGTTPPIFLQGSTTAPTAITLTATYPPTAVAVGDDVIAFATDPRVNVAYVAPQTTPTVVAEVAAIAGLSTGDLIFYHNQFFYIQRIFLDVATWKAKIDKPFGGSSANGGPSAGTEVPYRVTLPADKSKIYNYVSECAGRGLCSTESGICTCFKGYTNDNCNTQNILAL